jgi:hypothetical protein
VAGVRNWGGAGNHLFSRSTQVERNRFNSNDPTDFGGVLLFLLCCRIICLIICCDSTVLIPARWNYFNSDSTDLLGARRAVRREQLERKAAEERAEEARGTSRGEGQTNKHLESRERLWGSGAARETVGRTVEPWKKTSVPNLRS